MFKKNLAKTILRNKIALKNFLLFLALRLSLMKQNSFLKCLNHIFKTLSKNFTKFVNVVACFYFKAKSINQNSIFKTTEDNGPNFIK